MSQRVKVGHFYSPQISEMLVWKGPTTIGLVIKLQKAWLASSMDWDFPQIHGLRLARPIWALKAPRVAALC